MKYLVFLVPAAGWATFVFFRPKTAFLTLFFSYLTVFYVPIFRMGPITVSIADFLFVIFLLSYGTMSIVRERHRFPFFASPVAIMAVLGYILIMSIIPAVVALAQSLPLQAVTPWVRTLQFFSFFLIASHVFYHEDIQTEGLFRTITAVILVNLLVGGSQYIDFGTTTVQRLNIAPNLLISIRSSGLFLNPNVFGVTVTLLSFAAIGLDRNESTRHGLFVLTALAGGFLSGSRTAIAVTIVLCIVYYALDRGDSVIVQPIFLILSISGALILGLTTQVWESRIATGVGNFLKTGSIESLARRFDFWERAIRLYQRDGFAAVPPTVIYEGLVVDNFYLSMLLQAGLVGTFIVLLMYLSVVKTAIASMKMSAAFAGAVLFVTVGIGVSNATMGAGNVPGIQVIFWTLSGSLVGVVPRSGREDGGNHHSNRY